MYIYYEVIVTDLMKFTLNRMRNNEKETVNFMQKKMHTDRTNIMKRIKHNI